MKYSEPLQFQLEMILVFLGVGFLLGAFYFVCTFFRYLLGGKKAVVFSLDLVFCLGTFFVLFSVFLSYTNGVWRMPALISAAAGFFLFRLSIGELLKKPLCRFAGLLRKCAAAFFRPMHRYSKGILSLLQRIRDHAASGIKRRKWERQQNNAVRQQQKNISKKEKNNEKALEK